MKMADKNGTLKVRIKTQPYNLLFIIGYVAIVIALVYTGMNEFMGYFSLIWITLGIVGFCLVPANEDVERARHPSASFNRVGLFVLFLVIGPMATVISWATRQEVAGDHSTVEV